MNEFTAALGLVAGRAPRRDRRVEERAWPAHHLDPRIPVAAAAPRRHDLGALQVHRLRADRALDRQGLRRAVPPPARPCRRPAEHRLGRRRTTGACRSTTGRSTGAEKGRLRESPRHGRLGLHRLARRRPAARRGARAAHLRPRAVAAPSTAEVDTRRRRSLRRRRGARGVRGCDAVIHLAAVADVDEVDPDPVRADRVNVARHAVVLDGGARGGVRRVVYAQHDLGLRQRGRRRAARRRHAARAADHFYTATKLAGEMYCRVLRRAVRAGARRSFASASRTARARGRPRSSPRSSRRRLRGEPLTIAGDGTQSRQFVYVEDLAEGVVAVLAPDAADRIFNLVGDENVSVREIAATRARARRRRPDRPHRGARGDLRRGASPARAPRPSSAGEPTTPFADGVRALRRVAHRATNGSPSAATASMIARQRRRRPSPGVRRL